MRQNIIWEDVFLSYKKLEKLDISTQKYIGFSQERIIGQRGNCPVYPLGLM